jgi:hypothetical protein
MASLANQTISSTYDGLIKTSTDQPVGVSGVQLLEDGVGNTLALSVGRANQGVTVTGTLTATTLTGTVSATSVLADGVIATTQATSDNSTKVATTAFVKSVVTAEDLDIAGDTGTGAVDLDSQTLTIAGTANEIETSASGQTITIGLPSSVTVGTLTATNLGGTLSTAAQANVTSVGTLSSLAVSGDLTVDTSTLKVDSANNRVGINTSSPDKNLVLKGVSFAEFKIQTTTPTNGAAHANFGVGNQGSLFISADPDADSSNTAIMAFTVNGSERMRINSSGNLGIATTSPAVKLDVVGQVRASTGILFGADTAAANALDDYEEGTWTPTITFDGNSVGITYGAGTSGKYTKIGNQVTVTGIVGFTNKGTSTGSADLRGLPFTVGNNNANYSAPALRLNKITFANQFQGVAIINSTRIQLGEITVAGTITNLTNADFFNDSEIVVTLTYFV